MNIREARLTRTPEEFVRHKHQIEIETRLGVSWQRFRPNCTCGKLRSKWQPTEQDAEGIGRTHIKRAIRKEEQFREQQDQAAGVGSGDGEHLPRRTAGGEGRGDDQRDQC